MVSKISKPGKGWWWADNLVSMHINLYALTVTHTLCFTASPSAQRDNQMCHRECSAARLAGWGRPRWSPCPEAARRRQWWLSRRRWRPAGSTPRMTRTAPPSAPAGSSGHCSTPPAWGCLPGKQRMVCPFVINLLGPRPPVSARSFSLPQNPRPLG